MSPASVYGSPDVVQTRPDGSPADPDQAALAGPVEQVLASVHTSNFPELLKQLGGSLVLSTYQAGKLVLLRPQDGAINTHFRTFHRPMGMACDGQRLALGTISQIMEFRNMPAVARRLDESGVHDAVFMLRRVHVTGGIDIHEMAFDGDGELWFINTAFSCLCTLDHVSSFVPRWRPSFVSHLSPQDRCHLNGLGMREGKPRYVTSLGETSDANGWRVNKRNGGLLIDIADDRILCRGLSMPHSPRWHDGRLWLLESGRGALVSIDPDSGERTDVARVPGFARGLDFLGPVAFIGLSQLRETNAFTDIPITEDNAERQSGVWAVHIDTGQTLGLLKFTGGVREIFAVQALAGVLMPEVIAEGELLTSSWSLPDDLLPQVQFC